MASTVNAAKLTVILKEEVKLNNQEYGNRNSVEINSINEVSQRVITVPKCFKHFSHENVWISGRWYFFTWKLTVCSCY